MKTTARLTSSPFYLVRQAAGSRAEMLAKVKRLAQALRAFADAPALEQRMERLRSLGHIGTIPNRVQLVAGSIDMVRFWIVPCAEDYYRERGINFTFHQLLRFLDEPASVIDPTGFLSSRDGIIGHLMQVVHANPCYDLQLLESHDSGLEELEKQILAVMAGNHPRAKSIGAVVEDPEYHQRLLEYTRQYMQTHDADAPLRDNVQKNPHFRAIEQTFGTLPRAMTYFAKLPNDPVRAAWHLLHTRSFPHHLASS